MTITYTTEAERLIEEVLRIDAEAFGGRWEVLTDGCGWTCIFSQYGDGGCILTEDVGGSLYEHEAEATAALIALYRTAAPRLALLLRASEEARVKAERERDDLLCRIHRDGGHYISEHGIEKACQDADVIVATLNVQKDEAETALADMRRGRDASDKALLDCYGTLSRHAGLLATRSITIAYEQDVIEAITAARSRAKPDGEEKKL